MLRLLDERIFSLGSSTYTIRDLMAAAHRWGDWAGLEAEVGQGLACVERADDTDDDVDDNELDSAAQEFRYARELVSGQEMEAWLARWSLDVDEWMEFVRRSRLRERWTAELSSIVAEYPVDPEDIEAALHAEAVCSGFLARMARKLAARASAAARARAEGWLVNDPATGGGREPTLEEIDVGFQHFFTHIVTPPALTAQIDAHRLDWILADCRCLSLTTMESAKEAALCVREDGMELDEVAGNAGASVEEAHAFLEDYDAALHDALLAARPGELVGPIAAGDRFFLVLVGNKVLPSLDDPAVRRRAEERLLESALRREVHGRVQWHRADLAW